MDRQIIIYELMQQELQRCKSLYEKMNRRKKMLPRGSITERYDRLHRYVREGGKEYIIPIGDDEKLLNDLRVRRHIKESLPELEKRIKICESFLKKHVFYDPYAMEASLPSTYKGIKGDFVFLENDVNIDEWEAAEYRHNTRSFADEHYTFKGVKCRSKSEALIGTCLEQRMIPYRYEQEFSVDGRKVYPDFTLLLKNKRRVVYLEHFGMLNDVNYVENSFKKIEEYAQNGLFAGINFFFTFETGSMPLNIRKINKKLDEIVALDRAD